MRSLCFSSTALRLILKAVVSMSFSGVHVSSTSPYLRYGKVSKETKNEIKRPTITDTQVLGWYLKGCQLPLALAGAELGHVRDYRRILPERIHLCVYMYIRVCVCVYVCMCVCVCVCECLSQQTCT